MSRDLEQRESDWKWLLNDPRGRRVAADLLRIANPMATPFVSDHASMAWFEGRRSVGVDIHTEITRVSQEHTQAILSDALGWNVRSKRKSSSTDDGSDAE